jgi:2-methylisocitrate lyase-like PEP mutase family enzyme
MRTPAAPGRRSYTVPRLDTAEAHALTSRLRGLAGVREATRALGLDLVINARTDGFLRSAGSPTEQLDGTLDRAARYLAAGADCV